MHTIIFAAAAALSSFVSAQTTWKEYGQDRWAIQHALPPIDLQAQWAGINGPIFVANVTNPLFGQTDFAIVLPAIVPLGWTRTSPLPWIVGLEPLVFDSKRTMLQWRAAYRASVKFQVIHIAVDVRTLGLVESCGQNVDLGWSWKR